MTQVRLTAEPRDEFGKGAARRLRRTGKVPAVIYGQGAELRHVALPGHELAQALRKPRVVLEIDLGGTTTLTAPRDVQRDPVKLFLEHVDLIALTAAEAKARAQEGEAIAAAEAAAVEAGQDPVAAAAAVEEAIAAGESAEDAAAHAVSDLEDIAEARTEANAAEAAAEVSAATSEESAGEA
ncbi:MAG: 50S ribosomal protein L25 [Actinomycetota bacterium]|nr:MAG: 50S ribosomal protein L25 [Actinomycetota bacterium]